MAKSQRPNRSVVVLATLGVAALVVAALLPRHGVVTPVRAVAALCGLVVVPGWIVARFGSRTRHRSVVLVEAIVLSTASFVIGNFLLSKAGIQLSTWWYLVVPVAAGVVTIVAGRADNNVTMSTSLTLWTIALVICAVGSAGVAHVLLPAPAPESSFSISVTQVHLTNGARVISFPLSVERVSYARPISLDVQIDFVTVGHVTVGPRQSHFVATVPLLSPAPCRADAVEIVVPGNEVLSPPTSCR